MRDAIKHGVGVGGVADNIVPFVHGELAGDDDGPAAIALLQQLQKIMPGAGVERGDPQAWLADVLARIADHPASKLDELLPWNWKATAAARQAA